MTLMAWEMLSGSSSPLFTLLNGTHCSLIRNLTLSGEKFCPSSLLGFLPLTVTLRKMFLNLLQSQSTKLHLLSLCRLNPRRRLMSSPNISTRNLQLTIVKGLPINKTPNLTLRFPRQRPIHLKF